MWSAIRYRRLQALVLLALAALITACAVAVPVYDRAMQQALTRLTVDAAAVSATAVQVRAASRDAYGPEFADAPPPSLEQLAALLPDAARPWFSPRIDGTTLLVVRADETEQSPVGDLQWRDGACAHLAWIAGGCPRERGDIAVSAADRRNFGLDVGTAVPVVELTGAEADDRRPVERLRVTGVYRQVPGPYWSDQLLTGASGFKESQQPYRPLHDTWLTAAGTVAASGGPVWRDPARSVTYHLDRSAVGVEEILRAGRTVTEMVDRTQPRYDDLGRPLAGSDSLRATVHSDLPAIGAAVERGRRQALVTVPLVMIQLGALALAVLALTLAAAVEQRRPEVAVARLRGAGRAGARRLVLAELLPVVLAGVPLGVALALAAAALARHTTLRGAAPFETGTGFWLAIGAAALTLAAVTWAVTVAGTRDRISALLRGVPTRRPGWGLGAVDTVVVAGSVTAVAAFASGGLRGPLALAAPALLALIAGLLLAHLVGPVATGLGRRLTGRGAYAAALAVLAVARRPVTRRVVTVVSVSSALLVFATYAVAVGARNRQLVAERDNGAAMVADVTGTDVSRVREALATLGDGGATPVVRVAAGDDGFRTTLAVDPDAFGRIALFPDSDPAALPWSRLRVPTGRRLELTGRALSLLATPDGFRVADPTTAVLQLRLIDAAGRERTAALGPVPTAGPRTLTGTVPCADGCTVAGLAVSVPYGTAFRGRVTLGGFRVAGGATDLPGRAADWRAGVAERHRAEAVADAPGTLTLLLDSDGTTTPPLASRYLPATLPALVTGEAAAGGAVLGDGLNGTNRPMVGIAGLPRAPAVAGAAAVVDLDLLRHWGSRVGPSARMQVWFDTEDPAALERVRTALRPAGSEISGVRRVSEVRAAYDATVPTWSLQLGVLAAVAGLLLAALVLVLLVASTWRRRTWDLACLAMTGMPRPALRRAAVGEQLPIVLVAVLAGGGCGLLAAAFALPTVPLFATDPPPSPLDLSAPWGPVLAVLAATLAALGLVARLCGTAVASRARLSRVREVL